MTSYYNGTGAWENSPHEYHKQYMEDERPRYPRLKDLYDAWFENPDNWDEQQSVDVSSYLESPIVIVNEERSWKGVEFNDEPIDLIASADISFPMYWSQKLTERQAEWLVNDRCASLKYRSAFRDITVDLAPLFKSYLQQFNPIYKNAKRTITIKSAAKDE